MQDSLSVIILTLNEERNLPACLASLCGLRCATYLVDSGSTDRTVDIASAHGAIVVRHQFDGYASQRNWAASTLPIKTPWVLHLDADERLTPDLVEEINSLLAAPPPHIQGFLIKKRTVFMGRWIRYGGHYPTYHLRLYRNGAGTCEARLYDQHFVVAGTVQRLNNDYVDVVASSVSTWTTRHAKWATMEALELQRPGVPTGQVQPRIAGNPIERRRWWRNVYGSSPLFARAFAYWFYRYFIRLGFLDGREGLVFHFLQGLWFRFLVDALIDENRRAPLPAVGAAAKDAGELQ